MKVMQCKTCKYADIAAEDRIIIKTYGTVTQTAGSVICICEKAKSITITDDDILCSGYEEVE
ncbi:hypothetical protein Q5O14_17830 [Eubacteriaceae bacterium ES2]|nr:hypothetical protein Q5O14_17830 [Eubacteriaceae bacterium ES2]